MEVTPDDTQQRQFRSIIEGWNAPKADAPKGSASRADAAKAALARSAAEAETGEVRTRKPLHRDPAVVSPVLVAGWSRLAGGVRAPNADRYTLTLTRIQC